MKGGIRVVTASYPGLPLEVLVEKGIGVIPVFVTGVLNLGNVNYKPIYGIKEDLGSAGQLEKVNDNLFNLLIQKKKAREALPGTSQPDEDSVREYFKSLFEKTGCEGVIALSIIQKDRKTGENHSGTYSVVAKVASEFGGNVKAICGETASAGLGILALNAVDLLKQGKGIEAVAGDIKENIERVTVLAALGDLYFASNGGRVNSFVKKAMGAASKYGVDQFVVPILKVQHGHLGAGGIALAGADNVNRKIIKMMPKTARFAGVIYSAKATYEPAKGLADMLSQRLGIKVSLGPIGPELGVHAGPKTWGSAYLE